MYGDFFPPDSRYIVAAICYGIGLGLLLFHYGGIL